MAILQGVPGLSIEIQVAEQTAAEYGDPFEITDAQPRTPTTSCYIESQSDARFTVHVRMDSRFRFPGNRNEILVYISIDGISRTSEVLSPLKRRDKSWVISKMRIPSKAAGYVEEQLFTFSPITKVDDHQKQRVARDAKIAQNLGTIKVDIYTAQHLKTVQGAKLDGQTKAQTFELSEKSMKGKELSHGTIFTKGRTIREPNGVLFTDKLSLGAFIFHYRSREALQKEFIIPRPSSPITAADDMANLSEGEIRRLARERLRDIKIEENEPRKVKREPSSPLLPSRPLKIIRLDDGTEAFDLTED